jgi:uncharacterized protein (DUF488 family)
MSEPFFTIGHSTRTIGAFIGLLQGSEVRLVVDVRTVPRSRANPQFNAAELAEALATVQIGYERIAELGGLRGRQKRVPREVNGYWQNESFHNYADYALGDDFRSGMKRLREFGQLRRCAIMCAEAVWWRCHRRIIADYLIAGGETVCHILGAGHVDIARLTASARPGPHGTLTYLERK